MEQDIRLLSGNEAIAQGAWEAGVHVGVGYPGTPSTETLEYLAKAEGVYAEWAPNEKVALEVAIGASMAGARALFTSKQVGINVAADPLFTSAYVGVNGGLVILAADDPGCYSSQNEQDSHFYALSAHIPMLEPSDSSEAKDFTRLAFDLSERFDLPFMIRSAVRLSHTKCPVAIGGRADVPARPYDKDPSKWVMVPAHARVRRVSLDQRIQEVADWAETAEVNRTEYRDTSIGIICAGMSYQYVRDALPEASILKLGLVNPLPQDLILDFASRVDKVYCVEEISTYLRTQLLSIGVPLSDPSEPLPTTGELSPTIIRQCFGLENPAVSPFEGTLPGRPPALCPGCPHRLVFYELSRMKALVTGDIGCYTLGASAPLSAIDSVVDMGASISMAHGVELAKLFAEGAGPHLEKRPVVAVIGDSTFAHSGISSLLGTIYNAGSGTVCILDNRTTAMTGQQGNPCNGVTLQDRPSNELDLMALIKAMGVSDVVTVNPHDLLAVRGALKAAVAAADRLSVIIFQAPCVLLVRPKPKPTWVQDCHACGACLRLGCLAIKPDEEGKASIDPTQCIGCGQCGQVCPFDCIITESEGE